MLDSDMTLFWSALLLAVAAKAVTAAYNPEICSPYRTSSGPLPPPLPKNFETKGDHLDHIENFVTYQEMYLDYTNSLGKYMYLKNGIEHHFLFDYQSEQVVEYDIFHPGVDIKKDPLSQICVATRMDEHPLSYIFGLEDDFTAKPKMYNSYEALRFGGRYPYAFNETSRMTDRGILVDSYQGCVYDIPLEATIAYNFYFTSSSVYTAGGTKEETVTGIEGGGPLRVPVRIETFGSIYDEDDVNNTLIFNKTESIHWFTGEPDFKPGTFQIPPYMYCEKYRGRKDMPSFPVAFSTRVQKTAIARDILGQLAATEQTSFEEIHYYKEKLLARRDYAPDPNLDTDIYSKFLDYNPVKTIYDFNTGVMYVTSKATGVCYAKSIVQGDFFETNRKSLFIEMGTPEEVFHMQTDKIEYKGTDFVRDIECDVWTGKFYDDNFNVTYIQETHMSTNGWHEEVDELLEYGVPVKHTIINQDLTGDLVEGIFSFNFLRFRSSPPRLYNFDISNCVEEMDHKEFAIILEVSPSTKKTVIDYRIQFLETAQYYLTEITQVFTPLRIQRLEVRQVSVADPKTYLFFTLVGKAVMKTNTPIGQPGANLDVAVRNLQKIVDTNQFAIKFYPPASKEATFVPARKGNLYVRTADGDLQAPPRINIGVEEEIIPDDVYEQKMDEIVDPRIFPEDEGEEERKKGMSSGALAALGISMLFIGVGIGIALMYLYVRRMSETKIEDRITLTPQTSVNTDEAVTAETAYGSVP